MDENKLKQASDLFDKIDAAKKILQNLGDVESLIDPVFALCQLVNARSKSMRGYDRKAIARDMLAHFKKELETELDQDIAKFELL
jgi:hypothetical protein